MLVARISLTLSHHFSLSFIASGRSSGQHPVSSHSCLMYVCAGRPAFAQPCVGVHKSTSLMSSSLLLQQCPVCLVRLTWIVFVIGGRWPYSWCLVECCRQDLFRVSGIFTRTMHQSTTPSLSQTIWPRWASRQFVTLPIVETLLSVTFAYSLISEAVVMRQLRRWKRLWRRSLGCSHKRTSMGPSRSCNGTTSAL